jgi:hypothetical protein
MRLRVFEASPTHDGQNNSPPLGSLSMSRPANEEVSFARYVPLLAWLIVILILLFIPLQIARTGFLPGGDARRHVAQAFTDKSYTQIIVLRPEYSMDHSPGWDGLLRFLHGRFDWSREALMTFSIVGLMLCVFYAPLPWLKRPEAWLAALLAQLIAIPELMIRLTQARPLLLTEGVLIAVLFAWSKPIAKKPAWPKLILTCLGISLSVWMHGAWYLWILPILAFLLARAWRDALYLAICAAAGIVLGAILTGKPIEFLHQALLIVSLISREHLPQWMLVGELRPSYGEFDSLALLAIIAIWRRLQTNTRSDFFRDPIFCMIVICWILSFKADRFWADWGVPAALVWMTFQFEVIFSAIPFDTLNRLTACCLLAVPLFLTTTNDTDRRYTYSLNESFLDASDPMLQSWLPAPNGIMYSAQMGIFYNTFYKNPTADWRYILGLEPALMPEDDLQIFRNIQRSNYSLEAYEPWIKKMHAGDRLAIESPYKPNLPNLQWINATGDIWLGRLPRLSAHH